MKPSRLCSRTGTRDRALKVCEFTITHRHQRINDPPLGATTALEVDDKSTSRPGVTSTTRASPIDIERWALSAEHSRVGYYMSHVLPRFPIYPIHHGNISRLTPVKSILHLFAPFYPTFAKLPALRFSYKTGNQVWGMTPNSNVVLSQSLRFRDPSLLHCRSSPWAVRY